LALELVKRYRESFKSELSRIDSETKDPAIKFKKYVDLFVETVRARKICLCGMFASDQITLPATTQTQVKKFFVENEEWLAGLLKEGKETGKFTYEGSPVTKAETIFSMLEGAMIAARLFNDEKRLLNAAKWVHSTLSE
jgi:TetR/AcrR family transcriptional repressor of nem operon